MKRSRQIPARPFVWSTETWQQGYAQRTGRVRSWDAEPLPVAIVVRRPYPHAWMWGYQIATAALLAYAIAVRVLHSSG